MIRIFVSWRWRLSALSDRMHSIVGTAIDKGDEWFLISVVAIIMIVVGFCVLSVIYDPVAIKNSQWLH